MAVLQIEVEEHDAAALPIGEMPGEIDRDRGRADAATRADAGDELAELLADRCGCTIGRLSRERLRQLLRHDRLDDVFGDSGLFQVAIEADIIVIADRDDGDGGLAHFGESLHLRNRKIDIADVDNQECRRPLSLEILNGLGDAAAENAEMHYRELRGAVVNGRLGRRISNESQERRAPGGYLRRIVDRRGAFGEVNHGLDSGHIGCFHWLSGSSDLLPAGRCPVR